MRKILTLLLLVACCISCSQHKNNSAIDIAEFKNPSQEFHPWVYWYWMNGNVTKEGALADIDAMAEVGIGGVQLMDIGIHPQGKVLYRSNEWWDIVCAVAQRCAEKGIKISFNCPGWALAGGPWITPETAMQELTWSKTFVDGGKEINIQLPQPRHKLDTYEDITALAYPVDTDIQEISMTNAKFYDFSGKELNADVLKDPMNNTGVLLPNSFDIVFDKDVEARSLFICMNEMYTRINLDLFAWDDSTEDWKFLRHYYSSNAAFAAQHSGGSFEKTKTNKFRLKFLEGDYLNFRTISFSQEYTMNNWTNMAAYSVDKDSGYTPDPSIEESEIIQSENIINLTSNMDSSGVLNWNAPAVPGKKWAIMRIGYTPTGCTTNPPLYGVSQLEVDKLSKVAANVHYNGMWKPVFERFGKEISNKVLFANHIDSYEAGWQNWTSAMPEEFMDRNGYDIADYLLAATGLVIDDEKTTTGFLWDFKRTISDMCAENFYGEITKLAERDGLRHTSETYGGPFEYLDAGTRVSIPMVEYWWPGSPYGKFYSDPISAGHTTKAERIGYEAFTSGFDDKFVSHPYLLKNLGDKIFASGVNWFVIHVYAQQPFVDPHLMPGFTCGGNGVHFDRGNTWFFKSKAWLDYISRCQYMLRLGEPVADLAYYTGAVNMSNHGPVSPFPPEGYDFDVITAKQLHELRVKDGNIAFPNGKEYRILIYSPDKYESVASLKELKRLADSGATLLINNRPESAPSLKDNMNDPEMFDTLTEAIWNYKSGNGKGRIINSNNIEKVLADMDIVKDYEKVSGELTLQMTHRKTSKEDIYFVANVDKKPGWVTCRFRTSDGKPMLYKPETGDINEAYQYKWTESGLEIPLYLEDSESVFVVIDHSQTAEGKSIVSSFDTDSFFCFEKAADKVELFSFDEGELEYTLSDGSSQKINIPTPAEYVITGEWDVEFTPGWGAPEKTVFPELMAWNEHETEGIRYYSGTAIYNKEIEIPESFISGGKKVFLDLGQVEIIAELKVNGKNAGIGWKPPFRFDISKFVVPGKNTLRIEIVNNWQNRLIGDEQYPDDASRNGNWYQGGIPDYADWLVNGMERPVKERLTFTSWKHLTKDDRLSPSGLLGPARIISIEPQVMELN